MADNAMFTRGTQKVIQEMRENGQERAGDYATMWAKEKEMVSVISLVASTKQEYVRSHYTNVAVEVDGRTWFVPTTQLVPQRSQLLIDTSSQDQLSPIGTRTIAGGNQ